MLYVYRRAISDSAAALAEALGGRRWRDKQTPLSVKARAGDRVICWGDPFSKEGVLTLNNVTVRSKFTDAEVLRQAGVSTVQVSRTRPVAVSIPAGPDPAVALWEQLSEVTEDFIEDELSDSAAIRLAPRIRGVQEIRDIAQRLATALESPAPVATETRVDGEWLGRSSSHVGGDDLLAGTGADYFSKKEAFVTEYRIHSFLNRSIRAGKKVHRTDDEWVRSGRTPHAWIRSWDGGWRILYDGVSVKQAHRDLAHSAVRALGLDFGAVDIGERADGTLVVLEVNRAPGLQGGTVTQYATAIQNWISGTWTAENVDATKPVKERRAA
jgi:hypothetical protein